MSNAKDRTIQQRLGFMDNDLKSTKHDEIMLWLDNAVRKHFNELIVYKNEWKIQEFYVTKNDKELSGKDKEFIFNDLDLPGKPGLEIIKITWEYPVTTGKVSYIVGFADMRVDYQDNSLVYDTGKHEFHLYKEKCSIYFEVKSSISSLGELIRQIRMYQTYTKGQWFVVSPEIKFAAALESQGITHIEYDSERFSPDEVIGPDGTKYIIPA